MEMTKAEAQAIFVKEYGKDDLEWLQVRMKNIPKKFKKEQYEIFLDMYEKLTRKMLVAMFGEAKLSKAREAQRVAMQRKECTREREIISELMAKRIPKRDMQELTGISYYKVQLLCREINPNYKPIKMSSRRIDYEEMKRRYRDAL